MSNSLVQLEIPTAWTRQGLVIPRSGDNGVVGDPCIVWDEEISAWRMFLFLFPGGHGHAVCTRMAANGLPEAWSAVQSLDFQGQGRSTHKPYVVQEAHRPNHAARINGEYWLVSVMNGRGKYIQRARASSLAGPWTWDPEPLIPTGASGDFDGKHADAVTGFYFPERNEVLYFYMGYPLQAQDRSLSPWGNAQGIAVQKPGELHATKLGMYLPPSTEPGHWASGWLGGLQLLPGKTHRWIAVLNASPTAPRPDDPSCASEEPAPSLGGWAYCDEEWPVKNWHFAPQPMEWIDEIPAEAHADGENTNLWRQQALVLKDERIAVLYNSGFYGKEQLYMKLGV